MANATNNDDGMAPWHASSPAPGHTIDPANGTHSTPQTPTHRDVHPRAEHVMVTDPRHRGDGEQKGLLLWWQQRGSTWLAQVVFVDRAGVVRQELVPADCVRQLNGPPAAGAGHTQPRLRGRFYTDR